MAVVVGSIGLGGCVGSERSENGTTTGNTTSTENGGSDGSGAWPSEDGGPGNTGVNTATAGPTADPTVETLYSPDELYEMRTQPVIDDGIITSYSGDSYLHAVSTTGEKLWKFKATAARSGTDIYTPAIRDGTVYFPTRDGLVAIADGERQWAVSPETTPNAGPLFTEDAVYLPTEGESDALIAYDFDGTQRWQAESDKWSLFKPAIDGSTAVQRGKTYGIGPEDALIAWDTTDGSKRWENDDITPIQNPVVADGTAYTVREADDSKVLTALSLDDGSVQWETDPLSEDVAGSPAVVDDELYLATQNELRALSASDGSPLWSSPYVATDSLYNSPRVDAKSVYLTTSAEKVVAVDRSDGKQRWSVAIGETNQLGTPNVSIAGGTLYVATDNIVAIS